MGNFQWNWKKMITDLSIIPCKNDHDPCFRGFFGGYRISMFKGKILPVNTNTDKK